MIVRWRFLPFRFFLCFDLFFAFIMMFCVDVLSQFLSTILKQWKRMKSFFKKGILTENFIENWFLKIDLVSTGSFGEECHQVKTKIYWIASIESTMIYSINRLFNNIKIRRLFISSVPVLYVWLWFSANGQEWL